MPNWITITGDHLKAAGYGTIVDNAASKAVGSIDPVGEAIEGAVARVRRAVSQGGNALDSDASKVPNSFRALTIRLALYALMERISLPLDDDQKDTKRNDNSDLIRVADPTKATAVEKPDSGGGSAEMQQGNTVSAVNVPRRQTGRDRTSGL